MPSKRTLRVETRADSLGFGIVVVKQSFPTSALKPSELQRTNVKGREKSSQVRFVGSRTGL